MKWTNVKYLKVIAMNRKERNITSNLSIACVNWSADTFLKHSTKRLDGSVGQFTKDANFFVLFATAPGINVDHGQCAVPLIGIARWNKPIYETKV